MNILVLHSELGVLRGGGENFTRNLFTAFAARGHHVTAAFVANAKGGYPISLPPCFHAIPIPGWWSMNLGQPAMARVARHISAQSRHRKTWDRLQEGIAWRTIQWHRGRFQHRIEREFAERWHHFDVVYVHSNLPLAGRVAQLRPTVLRLPGPVTAECAPLLQSVPVVCANGDALNQISAFLGDHAVELPVGLDYHLFTPGNDSIRSALGWTDRHIVIGYVGRLTHLKGVAILAAAFREISRNVANARLLIIGSGAEENNIRPLLAEQLCRGIVHIEPDVNHEQLPQWYRAMDVFVMPSRYENFSNAMLEAMACAVPFLASSVGGNRIFGETGAGWLFEPGSVSSLIGCLSEILQDGREQKVRGQVARNQVQSRYSWTASAERLEQIIESSLDIR